jgi:hypothetical protein
MRLHGRLGQGRYDDIAAAARELGTMIINPQALGEPERSTKPGNRLTNIRVTQNGDYRA